MTNQNKLNKKQDKQLYRKHYKENKKYIKNKTLNKDLPKQTNLSDDVLIQSQDVWKIVAIEDKRYDLVKGISLTINKGDFVMIFGESGSGKTSLISLLSGLERPSEGNVNLMGYNTCTLKNEELTNLREKYIGYIFQQYGLLKDISVLENIVITCKKEDQKRILDKNKKYKKWTSKYLKNTKHSMKKLSNNTFIDNKNLWMKSKTDYYYWDWHSFYEHTNFITYEASVKKLWQSIQAQLEIVRDKIFSNEYIYDILKLLEIDSLINEKIIKLSGGQQQRVSIARAISKKPKILFADEPTGAVDTATAKSIMKLFIDLNMLYNTTIVMVTHNNNLVSLANRKIIINSGYLLSDEYNSNILSIDEIDFE